MEPSVHPQTTQGPKPALPATTAKPGMSAPIPGIPAAPAKTELQLADIHLPQAPAAWPPAWGWWLLLALVLAMGVFLVVKYRRFKARKQRRQQVLHALDTLAQRLHKERNTAAIADLNILLRRLALTHFPRQQVASLTGKKWLEFLDKSANMTEFTQGAGRILADAPYLAEVTESADIDALIKVVRKWVRQMANKERIKTKNKNKTIIKGEPS